MKLLVNAVACRVAGGRSVALNFLRSYRAGRFPHDLVVYAPDGAGYEELEGDRLRVELAPSWVHRGFARGLADNVWFRGVLAREEPDVLFAMGSIAYPTRLPQLVLFHWPYAIYPEREVWERMRPREQLSRTVRRWLFARRARHADCFAAQTSTSRERLERYYGLEGVAVVPNAVSVPLGLDDAPSWSLPEVAIPPGKQALLCLARYYPHKNHDVLLQVAEGIRERDLPYVILTTVSPEEGPAAVDFLDAIQTRGLASVLINLGTVPMEEIPALYGESSGLLLPTVLESFSGTYVEAMFHRKPVFTSDRDFARDVCGDVAWYFDPHDPDSILETIHSAFADREALDDRLDAGRKRCEEFADWPEVTERYVRLLERVAKGG